jgi:hypothetical protein
MGEVKLTNLTPLHEVVCGSGGIAPAFMKMEVEDQTVYFSVRTLFRIKS